MECVLKYPHKMALAVSFALIASGVGIAQSQHHGMPGQKGHMMKGQDNAAPKGHEGHGATASDSASTKAFKAANDRMHAAMSIAYSGDADVDFVKGMIPHHQGAVDMAKVVLEHGKDAELRRLAEGIIKAQNDEIAFMTKWLEAQKK